MHSPGEQEPDDCIDNMLPVSETATIPWPRDDLSIFIALAFARLVPCSGGVFGVDNLILAVFSTAGWICGSGSGGFIVSGLPLSAMVLL